MGPPVYVITGANRGIGLALVTHVLQSEKAACVAATARVPSRAAELHKLRERYEGRLQLFALDANDDASVEKAAWSISETFADGIDVLINNAGMLERFCLATETSTDDFRQVLQVNTVAPFLLARQLLPLLRKRQTRRIANTTSTMGSLQIHNSRLFENRADLFQGWLPYCASKAGINMVTSVLANELQPEGFTVISLHPGHVDTELSQDPHLFLNPPALTPAQSAASQMKLITALTMEDTGKCLTWEGEPLPY